MQGVSAEGKIITDDGQIAAGVTKASNAAAAPQADRAASQADVPFEDDSPLRRRRYLLLNAMPAWLVSMLVHILLLLVLAYVSVGGADQIRAVLTVTSRDTGETELEQFELEEVDPGALAESDEPFEELPVSAPAPMEKLAVTAVETPLEALKVETDLMNPLQSPLQLDSMMETIDQTITQTLDSRAPKMKKELLRRYGGNESSEAAVARALKWLALHQLPNGAWSFSHTVVCNGRDGCRDPGDPRRAKAFGAATGLALLPFLGAGQTHLEGEYRNVVKGGLTFLVNNMKVEGDGNFVRGDWGSDGGQMYGHGIAAIALCEAYAMTEDPALRPAAQAMLNHIAYAQCADGGWRYTPKQSNGGDTSVVGWQVMALKSGHMAHLMIPRQTILGIDMFLNKVQTGGGAYYGYDKPVSQPRAGTTAAGLLCRMYMGWDKTHPGLIDGAKYLEKVGVDKKDIYYDYYAAQVLRHIGGSGWEAFNNELRDWLVSTQADKGHAAGSWFFPESKSHRGPHEGGRLCSTAFATMILEVYYRHMPLYADGAAEDEFPL